MRSKVEFAWVVGMAFVWKRLRPPEVTKKGKIIEKKRVRIEVPRLFVMGDFGWTKGICCVPVGRDDISSWSVSVLAEPEKPLWLMLQLRPDAQVGPAWKRWASMTVAEFSQWLSKVLGPERAMQAQQVPYASSFFHLKSSFSALNIVIASNDSTQAEAQP